MTHLVEMVRAFRREEDGVALTEYLVLLALLLAGVVVAVGAAGESLTGAWENWEDWWGTLPAPDGTGDGTTT